jgi:hypothetical protein
MTNAFPVKIKDLSARTVPGRLGFFYAIEVDVRWRRRLAYGKAWDHHNVFYNKCRDDLGRCYQTHWTRKQPNRKWYFQHLDNNNTVRFCFKSKNQRDKFLIIY